MQRRRDRIHPVVENDSESNISIAASSRTMANLTLCLVFIAVLSAVVTFFQWLEIHSSGEDTHAVAVATGQQAAAAERQIAVMNSSQRAWVGPTNAFISGAVEAGNAAKINVNVSNTGREPAKSIRTSIETLTLPFPGFLNSNTYISQCFSNVGDHQGYILLPTTVASVGNFVVPANFTAAQIDKEVMEGTTLLLIRGCITYETVGQTKHSAFCYWYLRGVTPNNELSVCRVGSDAD